MLHFEFEFECAVTERERERESENEGYRKRLANGCIGNQLFSAFPL